MPCSRERGNSQYMVKKSRVWNQNPKQSKKEENE